MFQELPTIIKPSNKESVDNFRKKLQLFEFDFSPKRIRPDFTDPNVAKILANLVNEDHYYDLSNLMDIDLIIKRYNNLSDANRDQLNQLILRADDKYNLSASYQVKSGSHIKVVDLNIKRTQKNNSTSPLSHIYSDIKFEFDDQNMEIRIISFFPSDPILRGYSVGRIILKSIIRFATELNVNRILIEDPTSDALGFYHRMGFVQENFDLELII